MEGFHTCGAIPAFLAENVGLGAWIVDRGEDTRSGEKADIGELILGCPETWFDGYSAPLVGLRGNCGDIHWVVKGEELLGKDDCLEKVVADIMFLDCGAPLGRVLRGSLVGLRMKREELIW